MYVISILMTLDKIKADRGGILRGVLIKLFVSIHSAFLEICVVKEIFSCESRGGGRIVLVLNRT